MDERKSPIAIGLTGEPVLSPRKVGGASGPDTVAAVERQAEAAITGRKKVRIRLVRVGVLAGAGRTGTGSTGCGAGPIAISFQ